MAINFDAIPDKNPSGSLEPGTYRMKVTKTEMKQPKDTNKPMFLEVTYATTAMNGDTSTFVDKFFESDSTFLLFKLKRFTAAAGIPLTGDVELKDISKLIGGKEVVGVITNSENTYKGKTTTIAEIDLFNSDCYYPVSDWAKFCEEAGVSADAPVEAQAEEQATNTTY